MNEIRDKLADRLFRKYSYLFDEEDSYDLAEDICSACEEKKEFMLLLKEWMNGKKCFHDYILNDFSLVELACRLDEKNPNIPVAILIFYLEENCDYKYRALTVVADAICVCDYHLLKGELCKYAIKDDGVWYFLNDNQKTENMQECQMWQVLLLNPGLIIQMTYDYADGTTIILQEDYSYLIGIKEERKE